MSITIILPWPDSNLMPNRKNGKHWGSSQAAKVRARQDGYLAAKAAMKGPLVKARTPLSITFYAPDARRRDLDNLLSSCKSALDGVAQALGIDDSLFRPLIVNDGVDVNKLGYVKLEIRQ